MKNISDSSKALGELANFTYRGTRYETNTLTKAGAWLGFQMGVAAFLGRNTGVYMMKGLAKALDQPYVRSMSTRIPIVIPAVVVGTTLGRMAQIYEDYTGKTTVTDYVIDHFVHGKNVRTLTFPPE
ncbi:hypothetical protein [Endozoicomonas sp. ONNA2]|uniref:hypothetical protein n=1 Tax=Endozoicomonas sp. ONNA2 TaxID=2828741 RepID=UPI00214898DC|nr:hypothetical protein [Endozoicomonas sp. ONNA2]